MEKRNLSWVLMAIGLVVALLAALGDPLGLGEAPGIGWKQSLGVIIGILLIALGGYWRWKLKGSH